MSKSIPLINHFLSSLLSLKSQISFLFDNLFLFSLDRSLVSVNSLLHSSNSSCLSFFAWFDDGSSIGLLLINFLFIVLFSSLTWFDLVVSEFSNLFESFGEIFPHEISSLFVLRSWYPVILNERFSISLSIDFSCELNFLMMWKSIILSSDCWNDCG